MPDMTSIAAAIGSFNALKDIAQAMINLHDTKSIQAKIIEFNGQLIDAQTKIFTVNEERTSLIQQIGALEKELLDLKAWETEKQRYELKAFGSSSFAYVVKSSMQGSEPPHQICATCYQNGKKSILQEDPANVMQWGSHRLLCPVCSTRVVT